ncbi:DarT ssDNA thymidine ADP-ribosyltransferase family protein [Thermogemmatispora onikobensis]|uniref:DarT ssDNA thymidine ADP-ribosyltransferase family protein n=1 Tax=Thermogemmatispora onikobensis TaxID=732234 RepID=UPI00159F14BB|nr:DarT ssDNA thymidine ADP-ribosyltransferase family protein [Thermogemmatispora onikobensis]
MEEPTRHPDADAILARLSQEGITTLYHFTSFDNIYSICHRGCLYSKELLEEFGILASIDSGGDSLSFSLDKANGNWNKVSLSFSPYTPMAYRTKRRKNLCYFCISPEIATLQGVIFTDTNANRNDHNRRTGLDGLDLVHFQIIRSMTRIDKETWKRFVQAEVLIPWQVPLRFVQRIAFVSQANVEEAQRLCYRLTHPPFEVDKRLFTDSRGEPPENIHFPYVEHLHFFDEGHPASSMLYLDQGAMNIYSRSEHPFLRVALTLRLILGTEIYLRLYSLDHPTEALVWEQHEPSDPILYPKPFHIRTYNIPTEKLTPGRYLFECYLDKIRRASYLFYLTE